MHTLPLGSILKGTYRVEAPLGEGGFARVYRASHATLGTPLAIKVLNLDDPSHLDPRLNLRERFLQEARLAASLIHPNICRVHDYGELPDGRPYLVMDFLEGNDLEQELRELGGILPPERAVKLVLQVLDGLEVAHARGTVHKDLKPSNLCLVQPATLQERAVITDFGIARVIDGTVYTAAKQIVGTARYIAPEYAAQQRVSPAIDVYQMGLILAEALTGLPCVPDGPQVVQMKLHIDGRLSFPESLYEGPLGEVLRGALKRDPDERYPNATVFKEALKQAQRPAAPKRPPKGNTQRVQEPPPLWSDPARLRALAEQGQWVTLREATADPRALLEPAAAAPVGEALAQAHLDRAVKLLEPVERASSAPHRAARWRLLHQARAGLRDLRPSQDLQAPQRALAAWLNLQRDPSAPHRLRALQDLLGLDDTSAPAWRELAEEHLRQGDAVASLGALDRALQLRPQDPAWRLCFGWTWDHLAALAPPAAKPAPSAPPTSRAAPKSLNPTLFMSPDLSPSDPTSIINAQAFAAQDLPASPAHAPTLAQAPAQALEALLQAVLDKGSALDLARQGEQHLTAPLDPDPDARAVRALYCAHAHAVLARQALAWAYERAPQPRADTLRRLADRLSP